MTHDIHEVRDGSARLALASFMFCVALGVLLARVQIFHQTGVVLFPRMDVFALSGPFVSTLFIVGIAGCVLGIVRRSHEVLFRTSVAAPAVALLIALWVMASPPHAVIDARTARVLAASAMAFWITAIAALGHVIVVVRTKRAHRGANQR